MNTVDLFNTLRVHHIYNEVLKFAVDKLMAHEVNLRVVHISGQHNILADSLSRGQLNEARGIRPLLQTQTFQPPMTLVEAVTQ